MTGRKWGMRGLGRTATKTAAVFHQHLHGIHGTVPASLENHPRPSTTTRTRYDSISMPCSLWISENSKPLPYLLPTCVTPFQYLRALYWFCSNAPQLQILKDSGLKVRTWTKIRQPHGDCIFRGKIRCRASRQALLRAEDTPTIIRHALAPQHVQVSKCGFRQTHGSPMGLPLSPALCSMVVASQEEIWRKIDKRAPL